jgi:hypothetical protein
VPQVTVAGDPPPPPDRTSGVMTWFAFAFDGAPSRGRVAPGWTDVPDEPWQAASRARIALSRAQSPVVRVYRCCGTPTTRTTRLACEDAALIGGFDATPCLARFARYCAAVVQVLWPVPELVREWIATGSPAVRVAAHHLAATCADTLAGAQRIAARIAMFAAHHDRVLLATREAASLAARLLGASSMAATELAVCRQERFLASALLASVPRDRISRSPIPDVLAA